MTEKGIFLLQRFYFEKQENKTYNALRAFKKNDDTIISLNHLKYSVPSVAIVP
jgi:TnpA family transposase